MLTAYGDSLSSPVHRQVTGTTPLAILIRKHNLNIHKLVLLTGINSRYLTDYKNNRYPYYPHHLDVLCKVFRTNPEDMLADEAPLYESRVAANKAKTVSRQ